MEALSKTVFDRFVEDVCDPPYLNKQNFRQDMDELYFSLEQDIEDVSKDKFATDDMYKKIGYKTLNLALMVNKISD